MTLITTVNRGGKKSRREIDFERSYTRLEHSKAFRSGIGQVSRKALPKRRKNVTFGLFRTFQAV